MGKSIRSKSQRINRAIRRELIHKPNEDKRLARLTEKQKQELVEQLAKEKEVVEDKTSEERMDVPLSKVEKQKLFLSRNQYKKRQRAQSKSRRTGRVQIVKKKK
ncbi:hypothetical protein BC833DRAFT_588643 [Globomyces pollinis-pini]|nr:hypothetical protein BC833DRAFT_588643 [Globomyces pollinis-pini]